MRRRLRFARAAASGLRVLAATAVFASVTAFAAFAGCSPAPVATAPALEYVERYTGGAGSDGAADLPLIIAIHGLGDRPESFIRLFDGFEVPARIVVPRAPTGWGPGYSWFPLPSSEAGSRERFENGLIDSAARIAELIAALSSQSGGAARPVVVTGFSQGGMLSFAVAALHPRSVNAAFPVAGLLPPDVGPRQSIAADPTGDAANLPTVEALHGDADRRVPVSGAESTVQRLRAAGYRASVRLYPGVGHTISAAMRKDLFDSLGRSLTEAQSATADRLSSGRTSSRSRPAAGSPCRDSGTSDRSREFGDIGDIGDRGDPAVHEWAASCSASAAA